MTAPRRTPTTPAWYFAANAGGRLARGSVRLWWTTVGDRRVVVVASFFLSPSVFPLRRVAPLVAANALVSAEMAMRPVAARVAVAGR